MDKSQLEFTPLSTEFNGIRKGNVVECFTLAHLLISFIIVEPTAKHYSSFNFLAQY